MDQWYVDAHTLAQPAIKAVEDGRTRIVPQRWEKTYFEWMRNIQPCVYLTPVMVGPPRACMVWT